jgi:hypothetical protein
VLRAASLPHAIRVIRFCHDTLQCKKRGFFNSLGRFHAGTSRMLQLERVKKSAIGEAVLP